MSLPAQISVSFDFTSGATFGYPFTIGDVKYGVLGTGTLASTTTPEPTVDLTPDVRQISIRRGRNIMRDTYEAGTCTVRVLDPLSYFNPQNTSSPYFGFLTPLRKLRVSATVGGVGYFLFSGYTTEYLYTYPKGQETGYVDIVCSDAFRLMQQATVTTVASATAGQDTGTRIGKILDQVQFPSSMRTVDTGQTTCVADPGTARTALDAVKNAEFSEQGAFYFNQEGTAIFLNRTNTIKKYGTTPIEFDQTTGIPYTNLVFAFDDKLIINSAGMTRVGGTQQVSENAISIAKYFPHQSNQENLIAQTDADTLNIAKIYVATRQETTIRIDAMTVDLLDPDVPTATMLDLDYFSNLKITNVQPDGSTIVKTLQAQGFAWNITPNAMSCTVTTLEPIIEGFIIGSAVSGIIGTNIMAY
ncbi:hypothetical protein UFOVP539_22 [uncultured Caudovirales phage]|uniref:Uncharacterized protein n=1 Tax=uncultured Caudovirales phage TaxID=2100421 RepID=A0A6J5MTE4_9CAUD|nr:hypothetical protein UFOVP539_22 [uncultured Caudovirales phage]